MTTDRAPGNHFTIQVIAGTSRGKWSNGAVHLSLGKQRAGAQLLFSVYRIQRALKCLPGESKSTRAEVEEAWAADLAMFGEEEKGQQRRGARTRVWTAAPLSAVLNAKLPIPRFTYLEEDRPPSSTDTETTRKAAGAHLFLFFPWSAQCCVSNRLLTLRRICFPSVGGKEGP